MSEYTFKNYQDQASITDAYSKSCETISNNASAYHIERLLQLGYIVSGLTSEAGEVSGKFKKLIRDYVGDVDNVEWRKSIIHEIGDVLWYVAMLCKELNISLGDVAEDNIAMLFDRKTRGVIQGNGDTR